MFGWFDPERREERKKVSLDRKHLAARSRRFLRNYLNADDRQKPGYYRAVNEAAKKRHPDSLLASPEMQDAEIAEATSSAALIIVMERSRRGLPPGGRTVLSGVDRTMQKLPSTSLQWRLHTVPPERLTVRTIE